MFERLRDALRAALDAATPPGDLRGLAGQMREAVVDAKVAVREVREALKRTELELAGERQRLADAERRGRLAAEIQDAETVEVANRFVTKHQERIAMMEKKLAAQKDELALAERELGDMQTQLQAADQTRAAAGGERSTEEAWREIQRAGGTRPGVDPADDLLKSQLERAQREATANRQLDELKKKLRKD
ncbi:MAG TPA: hypothetical protein VNX15_12210 [Gemmatimonadales bacterium]|nr:hypothetical protein [Gemmatimonadales bacterium]